MTNEQLDEIEKLAEAATPGPWNHSFEFIHPNDGGISDAFIVCRHTEGGYDAAFLCAMREYALPLVKALREARELAESNMTTIVNLNTAMHLQAVEAGSYHLKRMASVEKERDEARAEVERLRSALRLLWEEAQDESRCQVESGYGHLISQPCWETVKAALKEGDR